MSERFSLVNPMSVECPTCSAELWHPCRQPLGQTRDAHPARVRASEEAGDPRSPVVNLAAYRRLRRRV